jgi:hypothetical protein
LNHRERFYKNIRWIKNGINKTQNPNYSAFANKRQKLGFCFLSRFQKIKFPNFTKDIKITRGLEKQNNYEGKDDILIDIFSFHMDWQEKVNSAVDFQFFTIRVIEGVIRAYLWYYNDNLWIKISKRNEKSIKNSKW